MVGMRKLSLAGTFAGLLSLSLLLVAGCHKAADDSANAPSGNPGGPGGPPGGMMGRGGPGGPGRGGPIAANASGSEILQKKCGCHGPNGKGGRAPALTGGAGKSEDELFKIIHDGKDKMPAFASQLTDAQINKVVAEVKSLK